MMERGTSAPYPPGGPVLEPGRDRLRFLLARLRLAARSLRNGWSIFTDSRVGVLSLVTIIIFALMAVSHPILMATVWDRATYDPVTGYAFDQAEQPAPPSGKHLLGTDPLGRDVLSQLLYSTRSEFVLGITAALVTVGIATVVGAVRRLFRRDPRRLFHAAGRRDNRPARHFTADSPECAVRTEPVLSGADHRRAGGFGGTAIVLKSQALSIRVKPFIEAARVAGGGHFHIIFAHIVPHLLPLSLLYMMFTVTSAIFAEAVLSFLGLLDLRMSWGIMIHTANTGGYLLGGTRYWWLVVPAAASITFLCSAFYLAGRALDEVVNPRLRRRND